MNWYELAHELVNLLCMMRITIGSTNYGGEDFDSMRLVDVASLDLHTQLAIKMPCKPAWRS